MSDHARKERKVVTVVFVDLVGFTAPRAGSRPRALPSSGAAHRGATRSRTTAYVIGRLARFSMLGDRHERAIELGREAIAQAAAVGDEELRAAALNDVGCSRVQLGDWDGLADLEASVALARDRSLAEIRPRLREPRLVPRRSRTPRRGLPSAGRRSRRRRARRLRGARPLAERRARLAALRQGTLAGGERARVDRLLAEFARAPFWIEPMAQVYRARLDLAVGDVATATDRARRIVELARAAKDLQLANPCLAFAASVKAELGNRDAAALAREVLEGELRRSLTFRRAVGATRYVREGERLLAAAS